MPILFTAPTDYMVIVNSDIMEKDLLFSHNKTMLIVLLNDWLIVSKISYMNGGSLYFNGILFTYIRPFIINSEYNLKYKKKNNNKLCNNNKK